MRRPRTIFALVGLSLALILIWVILGWIVPGAMDERSEFGGGFGGAEALFAAFAFAAFVWALRLQTIELAQQRESLERQNQLTAFFQILGQQRDIAEALYFWTSDGTKVTGRAALGHIFEEAWEHIVRDRALHGVPAGSPLSDQQLSDAYGDFVRDRSVFVSHYFRNLSVLLDLLDMTVDEQSRAVLANALAGQTSGPEGSMLLLLCAGPEAHLVEQVARYRLLETASARARQEKPLLEDRYLALFG